MHNLLKSLPILSLSILTTHPTFAHANEFRYRYIDLNGISVPGYSFFLPAWMNDSGEIAGTVYKCDPTSCTDDHVAIYKNGKVTPLQPGDASTFNNKGTIGGYLFDPDTSVYQAALFNGKNNITLIPEPPTQSFSIVSTVNDNNDAIVVTFNRLQFYSNGTTIPVTFGPDIPSPLLSRFTNINNHDLIAGTNSTGFEDDRAFRSNARTGVGRLLDPVASDTLSWGIAINAVDNVLGYSFITGSPYHERIGIWDRLGHFKTYYKETINTDFLAFNDRNQILQPVSGKGAYLYPRPGLRLNLADLVENLPDGITLDSAVQINKRGDIFGFVPNFLLKRICSPQDEREADTVAAATPQSISPAAMQSLMSRPQMRFAAQRMLAAKHS